MKLNGMDDFPMEFSCELEKDFEIKYTEFCKALAERNLSLPISQLTESENIKDFLKKVFIFSDFVADNCIRAPELLTDLMAGRDLFASYSPEIYQQKLKTLLKTSLTEAELKTGLLEFKKREMIRVAWRDLCGLADFHETVSDLSGFADACVQESVDFLYRRQVLQYGIPENNKHEQQHLVVLAMGKLGANELNFSSDIDLVFAFPEKGNTRGGKLSSISNEEFFTRLARWLIRVLSSSSSEGSLFRVDMRLRPYGENGPLVMTFDNMEEYYQYQGREWERYAWLRARSLAGDIQAGNKLLKKIQPFVYRRYLDYTVLESLRKMKSRIAHAVKQKESIHDVKLGPGGIREIEFFCHMFQILRGGVTPSLQGGPTVSVLKRLVEEKYIEASTCEELTKIYIFLRNTEHRLQEVKGLQIHTLPKYAFDQERLAKSMGFDTYFSFTRKLNELMNLAHTHFTLLLQPGKRENVNEENSDQLNDVWPNPENTEKAAKNLRDYGYKDPEKILSLLAYLEQATETRALSDKGRERVDRLMPILIDQVGKHADADRVFGRIIDLIKVIERRTSYIAFLLENPTALSHLIRLAGAGPWIVKFLSQHPVLLDELLDPRTLYNPPGKQELNQELEGRIGRISGEEVEYQIETMCIFKQINVLRVAAADVTKVLSVMEVSDHLTQIAETVLENVYKLAWRFLVKKHGLPSDCKSDALEDSGFLVLAYGKLGGIEMGYHSDVDLVFLHSHAKGKTKGPSPVENAYFYARLGQRIVHILSTHTRAGVIYQTDMRLRPSGNAGPLVSEIKAYLDYQINHGWTWEQQALVRARAICGDPEMAAQFDTIRKKILSNPKDAKKLKQEIVSMRDRLKNERRSFKKDFFDFKNGPGGIIDIEFLVQYLVLAHAGKHEDLLAWTDTVRLLGTLAEKGILDPMAAEEIKHAYLVFRSAIHKRNLQDIPPTAPIDQFYEIRKTVLKNWEALFS